MRQIWVLAGFCTVLGLAGCGSPSKESVGLPTTPTTPPAVVGFALSLSNARLDVRPGGKPESLTVRVVPSPGFTSSVTLSFSGGPGGVTVSPATANVSPGGQQIVVFVPELSAAPAEVGVTIHAVGGGITRDSLVLIAVLANQRTFKSGRTIYMERSTGNEIVRLGVDSIWGGLVVEASVNGLNAMDRNDPGRGVGLSFQDSTDVSNPSTSTYFNPVQGGNDRLVGSPILRQALTASSIVIETEAVQWNSMIWGGSATSPILSGIKIEQSITPVSADIHAFRIHYRVNYTGSVNHGVGYPEFPCLYVLKGFDRLMSYSGDAPWTGAAASQIAPPVGRAGAVVPLQDSFVRTLEKWVAYVNNSDYGIALWVPAAYPSYTIRDFVVTNYAAPSPGPLALRPGLLVEGDAFIYIGDYKMARQLFAKIRTTEAVDVKDPLIPMLNLESPTNGATVTGTVPVRGWAFDNVGVSRVDILIDGSTVGSAVYGAARPDVENFFRYGVSLFSGFTYLLDSRNLTRGPHQVTARVIDGAQNTRIQNVTVQVP